MNNNLTKRIDSVRDILKEHDLDALLISNFFNITYLSSFTTLSPEEREAYLLITKHSVYLFTDARYVVDNPHVILKTITLDQNLYVHLKEIIKLETIKTLGFEKEDLKYYEYEALNKISIKVNAIEHITKRLREIKTSHEIDAIKKACQYTDQCLKYMRQRIKINVTEKEIAWQMEQWVRGHGLELAFNPIVAVDKNSSIPHYDTKAGNGHIKKGSLLLIDFGIKYHGYSSDITRMFSLGKPSQEISMVYEKLLLAQIKTVNKISSFKQLVSVDRFARQLLLEAGLPNYNHGTGHGIGLEVHEAPKITQLSKDILKANQVITIEPGVYMIGNYGVRVEDTIYINHKLQPEVLTKFPKALQVL